MVADTVICATNRPDYIKDSKHLETRFELKEGALKIGIQTKTPSNAIISQILTFAGWLATVFYGTSTVAPAVTYQRTTLLRAVAATLHQTPFRFQAILQSREMEPLT